MGACADAGKAGMYVELPWVCRGTRTQRGGLELRSSGRPAAVHAGVAMALYNGSGLGAARAVGWARIARAALLRLSMAAVAAAVAAAAMRNATPPNDPSCGHPTMPRQ
eukprot:353504-Chlamydomonas_euryale.AAC.9